MTTIPYNISRDLPLRHQADVIVVGGGPGGLGAAVMAARAGAKTLLIERFGCLGGMASVGEIHPFMDNHANGVPLDQPVYTEWLDRMQAYRKDSDDQWARYWISKDVVMLAAEELCLEAGVQLLYHHTLADVVKRDGAIDALVLHSKSDFTAAKAPIYIDCTGDADLAARAGCECEQGGPSGFCQPMTLCFKLSHVDTSRAPNWETMQRLYEDAKAAGEIHCPRENVLQFPWFEPDVIHFNTTRVIRHDGASGEELSAAEIEGRRQVREFLRFFRTRVPGYEQAQIHSVAHHIGVRETRRVRGLAYLTRQAFIDRAKFPDAIARVNYPIDIHNPNGSGTELLHIPDGDWYEIPYGCIVARDCANLLIGGRPISADHALHSSFRVMPPACSIGQAAGMAAAMSAARRSKPAELDGVEVRQELVKRGAYLREVEPTPVL